MDKIFVDSDIIIDLLAGRTPHNHAAEKLFSLADIEKLPLATSSLVFSNVHYVLAKKLGKDKARQALQQLKVIIRVLPVDDKVIDLALASSFSDFEDAIQYFTAIENQCGIILTRNLKDYKDSQVPVMTAESFVSL